MVYKYLGWGITNENGVAKLDHDAQGQEIEHSYTGTGAGEIDVLASLDNPINDSSIVSGTFNVIDAQFRDGGKYGDKNPNWTPSNITAKCDEGDTYTTLSNTSSSNGKYTISATVDYTTPFAIEFKNHLTTDSKDYIWFNGSSNSFFTMSSRSITGECDVKIIVDDKIYVFVDGEEKTSSSLASAPTAFAFRVQSGGANIGYSNFVIYPI